MQLSFQVRKLTTFIKFKIKADCNFGKFQALSFFFFFLRKVSFNTMRPTWSPYFHIKFHPWSYLPALSHSTLMLSHFSHVQLFATPLTAACQIPLSIGFSRQEYWNRLPCLPSGDLPHSGMEPTSFMFPTSAGGFFTTSSTFGLQSLLKFLSSRRASQEIKSLPYKIWQVLWQSSSVLIPREFTIATVRYSSPRSGTVGGLLAGWRTEKSMISTFDYTGNSLSTITPTTYPDFLWLLLEESIDVPSIKLLQSWLQETEELGGSRFQFESKWNQIPLIWRTEGKRGSKRAWKEELSGPPQRRNMKAIS